MNFTYRPLNNNGANNYSINSANGRYQGNSLLKGPGAMPAKFYPSDGTNTFSLGRQIWTGGNTRGDPRGENKNYYQAPYQSSDYMRIKKMNAIGKGSYVTNNNTPISFSNVNKNTVTHQRRMVRSGGAVAPPKKGARASS